MKKLLVGGILFALLFSVGVFLNSKQKSSNIVLNLSVKPHTPDPYEFDHMVHQAIFPSVLSPLVSVGRTGTYQGVIAERWSSTGDYKTWSFNIRPNLKFSNGKEINPEAVASSLKRIIFLQKKAKSLSGLSTIINGLDSFNKFSDDLSGIRISRDTIVMSLNTPTPNFLDIISFGIYSIVSSDDFDSQTAEWLDSKKVSSSGGYTLRKWDEKKIELSLREDFLIGLKYPKRAKEVIVLWNGEKEGDIFPRTSISPPKFDDSNDYTFHGPVPSGINYIRLGSYLKKGSLWADRKNRQALRNCFYEELEKNGQKVTKSFLPLAISTIKEFNSSSCDDIAVKGASITYAYPQDSKVVSEFGKMLMKSFADVAMKVTGVYLEQRQHDFSYLTKNMDGQAKDYDLFNMGTSVRVEDPFEDIRFMFLSKEGVRLPDETGEIRAEIQKSKFSVQKVNELIWEQALVWPITHFSYGFWASSRLDLSETNLLNPALDFNWIGVHH